MDVDRVLSRAFTPTIASYAVYTKDCDTDDLGRIREGLTELRLDDGRAAFDGVWTLSELYGDDPVPPAPTFFYAPAIGVRPSIRVTRPFVDRVRETGRGAHQRDGMVIVAGPDVVPGELARPSLADLCPTLLWLMGAPIPAGADGRVLFELFTEEAAAGRELREVDATAEGRPSMSEESTAEIERRLRALGYV
jgi:hypothetical protein